MQKRNLRSQAASKVQLPCAEIHITDNRRAIIDGAQGVVEYTPCCVRLKLGRLYLSFCGEGMTIKTLCDDKIIVEGEIISAGFSS